MKRSIVALLIATVSLMVDLPAADAQMSPSTSSPPSSPAAPASSMAVATDAVTQWTAFAIDPSTGGDHYWRDVALMHAAMHDVLNAIRPRFDRWTPASPSEPGFAGAIPEVAVAAAAHAVLSAERPYQRVPIDAMLALVLDPIPEGPGKSDGIALGRLLAATTLARRSGDDSTPVDKFSSSTAPGVWRPTLPELRAATIARYRPFAFDLDEPAPLPSPPLPGSTAYREAVNEVKAVGARRSERRAPDQTEAAWFWAKQSPQRNFHAMTVHLLAKRTEPHDIWESARTMALLSFALSDSYFLSWATKERMSVWRPITAIQEGGFGIAADPNWQPLLDTPPHPDFPSAHAADCSTSAHLLRQLFQAPALPIRYVATDTDGAPAREFPTFMAIATECAESRLWGGVHFRTANDAGFDLGEAVAARVVATMLRPIAHP